MPAVPTSNHRTIAITGLGAFCPIGRNIDELLRSIRLGHSGFDIIRSFDTERLKIRHAAEIADYEPLDYFPADQAENLDRTAQFAIIAARQAVESADLSAESRASGRVALVMGICAGGQGGNQAVLGGDGAWGDEKQAQRFLATAHYFQTDAVASALGIRGPGITVSTACASSTSALGVGFALIQAGKADVVLVGGADAFSLYTYAGFYALGAMAEKPTSPFSIHTGVTFGEGAGCVVLERLDHAEKRRAHVYGELLGCGMSSDAHHITAPHPSGEGVHRAMVSALQQAGITASELGYINAHGTGTPDNDVAETLAIHSLYGKDAPIPPVSSSKSFFGHTLGAAGILEFIVSLSAMLNDLLPPTLNFEAPRPGCDLDYVPNQAREAHFDNFISTSAAFGGVNAAVIGGRLRTRPRPECVWDDVLITGMGLLSPVGFGPGDFAAALRTSRSGVELIDRFDCGVVGGCHAGLLKGFQPRKLAPTVDTRRMDRLTQYAVVATSLALRDADPRGRLEPSRLGLTVALTRGPVSTQERFLESLYQDGIERMSAKYFPSMVLSTLSGEIAQACRIKGANLTIVDGRTAGLRGLLVARDYLRQNEELDALVVVAADEIGALFFRLFERLGMVADTGVHGVWPRPYDQDAGGVVLGEGAVALVLERKAHAQARGAQAYAQISGCGMTADAEPECALEPQGHGLEQAARLALEEANLGVDAVDAVYGHGCGDPQYDRRELQALARLLEGRAVPMGCVVGHLGLAEASCGLFSVAAALLGMRNGEVYPIVTGGTLPDTPAFAGGGIREGHYRHALVLGSTEHGGNASVVLSQIEQESP